MLSLCPFFFYSSRFPYEHAPCIVPCSIFRSPREEVSKVLLFREPKRLWLYCPKHGLLYRYQITSFQTHLLLTIHLEHRTKGHSSPPMCTHGGSSFPRPITLFGPDRRGSRAPSQNLVPLSGFSFLVPESRSSFRSLVPRSGFNLYIHHIIK